MNSAKLAIGIEPKGAHTRPFLLQTWQNLSKKAYFLAIHQVFPPATGYRWLKDDIHGDRCRHI